MDYTLYVDESYYDGSKYIVMAGFGIPQPSWRKLNKDINSLKLKYFGTSEMNLKMVRRWKSDPNKYWANIDNVKRNEFNDEFYKIICNTNNVVIASLINKEKITIKKNKKVLFELAYSFILQRYQYFLSQKGFFGNVIMDSSEANDEVKNLYETHKSGLNGGLTVDKKVLEVPLGDWIELRSVYTNLKIINIVENLIFMDDADNNMLQIGDIISAAISAKYNRKTDVWYDRLKGIIRKSDNGKIEGYGIKEFPN